MVYMQVRWPLPTLPLPPDTLVRVGTWWVGEGLGRVLVPQAISESEKKLRKEHRAHTPAGPMHVAPTQFYTYWCHSAQWAPVSPL